MDEVGYFLFWFMKLALIILQKDNCSNMIMFNMRMQPKLEHDGQSVFLYKSVIRIYLSLSHKILFTSEGFSFPPVSLIARPIKNPRS